MKKKSISFREMEYLFLPGHEERNRLPNKKRGGEGVGTGNDFDRSERKEPDIGVLLPDLNSMGVLVPPVFASTGMGLDGLLFSHNMPFEKDFDLNVPLFVIVESKASDMLLRT